MYLKLINGSITMFGSLIQSSQINCSSVWCFLYINFWHFEHFVFNLLFSFSPSALQDILPTIASKHLKHLTDVGLKFSGLGWADTSLIPRTHLILLITAIFNPFHWLYLLLIACKTNSFSRLKVISKFVSCKMVFALERQVSRINASSFKGYFLDFIHIECVANKRSTTSMPAFEGSYTVCMLGFFHWSFVILTLSCIVDNTIKLFLPLFFLSM